MQLAYIALMIAALVAACLRLSAGVFYPRAVHADESALVACFGAVILNWIVNTAFVLMTGDTDPEWFFFLTDTASLVVVCRCGAGWPRDMLASLYVGQIIAHWCRFVGVWDAYAYWQLLTILGFVQLLALGLWSLSPAVREPDRGAG